MNNITSYEIRISLFGFDTNYPTVEPIRLGWWNIIQQKFTPDCLYQSIDDTNFHQQLLNAVNLADLSIQEIRISKHEI